MQPQKPNGRGKNPLSLSEPAENQLETGLRQFSSPPRIGGPTPRNETGFYPGRVRLHAAQGAAENQVGSKVSPDKLNTYS